MLTVRKRRSVVQTLRGIIQWIVATVEALRWQPPGEMLFPDVERIERGECRVEKRRNGNPTEFVNLTINQLNHDSRAGERRDLRRGQQ